MLAGIILIVGLAPAQAVSINLNNGGGIPGTGGSAGWIGQCYCGSTITYSPIFSVTPGETVDFGAVTIFPFEADATPDAGPYQELLVIQSDVGVSFAPPVVPPQFVFDEPALPNAPNPNINFEKAFCELFDSSCTLESAGFLPITTKLEYIIPAGASSIQLAWVGDYEYAPPTPLPAAFPLFVSGLGALCLLAKRRKRKA